MVHILGLSRYSSTYALTSTAATGAVWLIELVGIPSGYRTERSWQTGRTREQTGLLLAAGQRSLAGPGIWGFLVLNGPCIPVRSSTYVTMSAGYHVAYSPCLLVYYCSRLPAFIPFTWYHATMLSAKHIAWLSYCRIVKTVLPAKHAACLPCRHNTLFLSARCVACLPYSRNTMLPACH